MAMFKKKNPNQDNADVNMTPMLDIVFILLIFFIVTSTFIREQGLDVTKNNKNEEQPLDQETKAVLIQVCANDDILLDKRNIDVRAIRANVERKLAEFGKVSVVVEAEPEASTGQLVKVMDQAIAAKATVAIARAEERCDEAQAVVAQNH
jgi:biopolymer transport protein ExbD